MSEDQQRVRDAAGQVRAVLGEVERGELTAESDQLAYLRGAADALEALSGLVPES